MKKYMIVMVLLILALPIFFPFLTYKKVEEIELPIDDVIHSYKEKNGFRIDEVYNHKELGEIHYSVYIPKDYDEKKEYPLYITLPGYEGLYFQGIGINLEQEDFALEAKKRNPNMIVLAPQLNDWTETSAKQTIALIEYYKKKYHIGKVYASGYSGGGETLSLVMESHAHLIDAYLHISSKWTGNYEETVKKQVPVYLVVGRNDEYYGSLPTITAYNMLYSLYEQKGLSKEEIDQILVLDIKEKEYFLNRGSSNEHEGGKLVAKDTKIMDWLFSK